MCRQCSPGLHFAWFGFGTMYATILSIWYDVYIIAILFW